MTNLADRLAQLTPVQRQRLVEQWQARQQGASPASIPRRAHDTGDFPLSFAQERLWFLDQLSPGNAFYNISTADRLPFPVDLAALERALTALVARHGALRTIFPRRSGDPVQRVLPPAPVTCRVIDLTSIPIGARDVEARRLAAEAAQTPFDLSTGPVFRTVLVRMSRFESLFVMVVHHIAADSLSMSIIFQELGTLYADAVAGRSPSLGDAPLQYADFAVWERAWLHGERLESALAYWRRQLDGVASIDLATDRPRPALPSYRGAHLDIRIAKGRRDVLYALAAECGATPFMLLLTAFFVLLHRYTQQEDIAVGVPVANRSRRDLEGIVGFMSNSLVIRGDMSGNPSFRQALGRIREVALEAYSHQHAPFSAVVAALKPEQDLSRNPLFQVSFQLISQADRTAQTTGGSSVTFERGGAVFDVVLNMWEMGSEVLGLLEYNTDLFEAPTVERMVQHYLTLLDGIAATPDTPIGSLPMLTTGERTRMLLDWNDTGTAYAAETIHGLVEAQVRRTPAAVALRSASGTLTYAELNARAASIAQRLLTFAEPGAVIAIMAPVSFDLVLAILGVLKAGCAYVPVEPATPRARLQKMLDAANARLVLVPESLVDRVPEGRQAVLIDAEPDPGACTTRALPASMPSSLAYIMFTSGSSGTPKGVMVTHDGVVNYLSWCLGSYPVHAGTGAPLCSPPWSDMSVTSLFLPLISGTSVTLLDQDDAVDALDDALRTGPGFSFVKVTPSHLDALRHLSLGREAPSGTAAFVVGGEALHAETLSLWRDETPDLLIFNEYGPTETVVGCAVHAVRAGDVAPGPIPIGKAIANTRLYVLDRYGGPVPVGNPGELYIAGAGVASGYVGAPALTAESFRDDPFSPGGGRMYRTGDRVRYRGDGTLEFLGRIDRQVKIRGFRIEPGDVESAIRRHTGVADVAVTVREVGSRDRRLVAHIVPTAGGGHTNELVHAVRGFLRSELPAHMIPAAIIPIGAIPLTAAGKVDTRALEGAAASEPPNAALRRQPRTPLERVVTTAFEEALGQTALAATDDFFADLGGHSLLATKAVARLRELLRVDLPLRWIFEAPTAEALATRIQRDAQAGATAEQVAEVLLAVLDMSDDQVDRLLASSPTRLES